jgi:anaerobic dimethyl sulfoxide reductase subunit B (iron-sulfur subunit)
MRLFQWEKGTFPSVRVSTLFAPCYQCQNPPCVDAANGGLIKEPKYGAILVDPAKATTLRAAAAACPYGAITFDSDASDATASKCTMCVDRLSQGLLPMCVAACQMRALDFGTLDSLKAKYPNAVTVLEDMPSDGGAQPAILFKPHDSKKQLVPYDANAALTILAARPSGLPQVFSQPSDVTSIPSGLMTKNVLKMRAGSVAEAQLRLADDQS